MKRKKGNLLTWVVVTALMMGASPVMAGDSQIKADSVYRNGNLITMNEKAPTAAAIAVRGDRIIYVGDDRGVDDFIGTGTEVTDLQGKTVLPGLMEGHMHIGRLGQSLLMIDAFWKPKAEILALVKAEAEKAKPGEWIQGRGWMNTVWEDTAYPSKEELDAVAPNNPVFLTRADNHMFWVNSKALELAGITRTTADPQGGEILKTSQGDVLGCLTDTAGNPVKALVPPFSVEKQKEALILAQNQLFSYGFTSAMDAGITVDELNNYKALYSEGKLKLRTYPLIMLASTGGIEMDYVKNNKPTGELFNNHMLQRAVKIVGDGSLGARSSAMLEDYSDRPGHKGNYRFTDQEIYQVMKSAYENGYQIGFHAIGDGANHQGINTYEKILKEIPMQDPRLRIEHFQIVAPQDMEKALKLGILPSMQPTHATSDLLMAEDRIGAERIKTAYAWRTVLDKGSIIIGGSDAPVELVNPYHGFYAGVTRMTRAGQPDGGWYPEQKMTREEVLRAFTMGVAYGQFEEKLKGSLEVGKLADFVVIDRDYMTCPESDIMDIQALTTVSGGEVVYKRVDREPTVMWQGQAVVFQSKPVNLSGTVFVPADRMAETVGAAVTFDEAAGSASVVRDEKTVIIPYQVIDGVNCVGVRDLARALGYQVNWYGNSRSISIH